MHIEKKHGFAAFPSPMDAASDMTLAEEHACRFPMVLAFARWTQGGDIPHVLASERNMPMRAGWYTKAQAEFQAWLHAGGFQQSELNGVDGSVAHARNQATPAVPAPAHADRPDHAAMLFRQLGIKTWPLPAEGV